MHPSRWLAGAVALFTLSHAGGALADAIDGDWCHSDGRRLTIAGPEIVTPAGKKLTGQYDRHNFAYLEPGASTAITMVLQGEYQMQLKPPAGDLQTWRRCGKPVS